jgi:hypothetical protein
MSKFSNIRTYSAAATFGAAALFSMLSFGSNAEAASVLSCKGATAAKAASCCEKVVEENGHRPLWMIQNRMNCHEAVSCKGRECYIKVLEVLENKGPQDSGRSRGK